MTREQAEQIARKHHLQVFNDKYASIAKWVIDAIMEAVAVEREECAKIVADAAPGFCGGRAETVLYSVAETIRARGERVSRKIRPELDQFRDMVLARTAVGICDGSCDEHTGTVETVRVFGDNGFDWGYFSYCETARIEDTENRGMVLEMDSAAAEIGRQMTSEERGATT